MAVEIKEIVIRAVLTDEEREAGSPSDLGQDKGLFIQECVNQVLKVLEKKKRR